MGTQINLLTSVTPVAGQSVPVYDPANGDARRWSLTALLAWIQANLVFPSAGRPEPNTQYAAPAATGFSVSITDSDEDTHLILTPMAGYAAGTIVLPPVASVRDKQLVIVNCTQAVAALTVDGSGAVAVVGAPIALLANDFFTLKYDATVSSWYRIG